MQVLGEIIKLLIEYPPIRFILPWIPLWIYLLYVKVIRKKAVHRGTFLILLLICGLIATFLVWLYIYYTYRCR